jgi:hypothetical protein
MHMRDLWRAKPATMVAGTTVCVMRVSLLIGAVGDDVFVFVHLSLFRL